VQFLPYIDLLQLRIHLESLPGDRKANLYTKSTILMRSSYFLYACSVLIMPANKAVYPARRNAFDCKEEVLQPRGNLCARRGIGLFQEKTSNIRLPQGTIPSGAFHLCS
jgi:hypothetical protein